MAFIPVSIDLVADGEGASSYNRSIQLTARQLAAFERASGDMTEPLTGVASMMRGQIVEAFATEGATGASGKWQILSEPYADWKASKGYDLPLLFGLRPLRPVHHRPEAPNWNQVYGPSGQMMTELLMPLGDVATWQVTPTRMRYTPVSDIAGYHETGTEKMPARPPVDLSINFLRGIDRTFVRWLGGLMKASGLTDAA